MVSLIIKQSDQQTEQVSNNLIDTLYNLTYEDELTEPKVSAGAQDIVGSINAPVAYEDAVMYLRAKFPNLIISVTDNNYYIRFKDPVIANILITEYGDGVGATQAQLSAVSNLNDRFYSSNNTDFLETESYDDMQYLRGVLTTTRFLSFVNAPDSFFTDTAAYNSSVRIAKKKSFTAPNSTMDFARAGTETQRALISGVSYKKKVQFEKIDFSKLKLTRSYAGSGALFYYVDVRFEDVVFPTYTEQLVPFFGQNGILGKFIYPEGVIKADDNFRGCNLSYIEYPSTLQQVNVFGELRRDGSSGGCMVFKSVIPPTHNTGMTSNSSYSRKPSVIYCPHNSVAAYQTWADNITWSDGYKLSDAVTIKSMAEMSQAERDMGTVTQEDIDRV